MGRKRRLFPDSFFAPSNGKLAMQWNAIGGQVLNGGGFGRSRSSHRLERSHNALPCGGLRPVSYGSRRCASEVRVDGLRCALARLASGTDARCCRVTDLGVGDWKLGRPACVSPLRSLLERKNQLISHSPPFPRWSSRAFCHCMSPHPSPRSVASTCGDLVAATIPPCIWYLPLGTPSICEHSDCHHFTPHSFDSVADSVNPYLC